MQLSRIPTCLTHEGLVLALLASSAARQHALPSALWSGFPLALSMGTELGCSRCSPLKQGGQLHANSSGHAWMTAWLGLYPIP